MTEPKLLPTEQEWRKIVLQTYDETMRAIRERGLIAPDPLIAEAIEIVVNDSVTRTEPQIKAIRERRAGHDKVNIALAALKRGMELAERPTLTREQVRGAMIEGIRDGFFSSNDITRLHAALTATEEENTDE